MGIIKSLEGASEEMRLHEMVAKETPKKSELLFDAETEIEPKDWEQFVHVLETYCNSETGAAVGSAMRLLSPEKFSELWDYKKDIDLANRVDMAWQYCQADAQRHGMGYEKNHNSYGVFYHFATRAKLTFPRLAQSSEHYGLYTDLAKGFFRDAKVPITDTAQRSREILKWGWIYSVLAPTKIDREVFEDEEVIEGCRADFMKNIWSHVPHDEENSVLQDLARTKILIPKAYERLEIDKKDIRALIERCLDRGRKDVRVMPGAPGQVVDLVWDMAHAKILAAESAEITEDGIRLVMPEEKHDFSDKTPLPERKKF